MGLFEKKLCAICGKKKGLLGDTLKDGNHLCCDCSHKAFGVYEALDVKTSDARALKPEECTLEDYKNLVAVREKQAQEVRQFHTDYSLGALHLDKRTGNLIFADPSDFKNMEKLAQHNPVVYNLRDLMCYRMRVKTENGETITGKGQISGEIEYLFMFDSQVAPTISVRLGSLKCTETMFGKVKSKYSPGMEEFPEVFGGFVTQFLLDCRERGEKIAFYDKHLLVPAVTEESAKKGVTPEEHVEIINSCAAAAHCTVEKLIESAYSD